MEGFDWESFGVLDRRSLKGGGRTWSFDWVINTAVDELCNL